MCLSVMATSSYSNIMMRLGKGYLTFEKDLAILRLACWANWGEVQPRFLADPAASGLEEFLKGAEFGSWRRPSHNRTSRWRTSAVNLINVTWTAIPLTIWFNSTSINLSFCHLPFHRASFWPLTIYRLCFGTCKMHLVLNLKWQILTYKIFRLIKWQGNKMTLNQKVNVIVLKEHRITFITYINTYSLS